MSEIDLYLQEKVSYMPGVKRNSKRRKDSGEYVSGQSLVKQLIDSRLAPLPQGPPKSEEDKQLFVINMVRLKEERFTLSEMAEKLGVSVSTIKNYMADPLYRETQETMIGDAKQLGHVLISELIPDAIATLYELMSDKLVSPFVRYKAATELLDKAGYNMERDEVKADSREGVMKFMRDLEESKRQQNTYIENLNIITDRKEGSSPLVVESLPEGGIPEQLLPYYQTVAPGGGLPDSFKSNRAPKKSDIMMDDDTK